MKKIFVLFDRCLLALLVTALLLTMPIGCGGRIETDDSGQPTESFLQEIATDFSAFMNSDGSTVYTVDACYGIYDHCIAVEFSGTEDASKERMEEIAGTVFSFWSGRDVWIWQNGDFFTLGDAYEKELLTDEQVRAIADARNNGQIETDAEGKPTERFLQNVAEDYANHLYQNHPFDVAKKSVV